MKITRNIFIILYAILLVINDPQVARAHTIEGIGISQAGIIENKPVYVDPYEETGQKAYHITYILNGGENSISNREVYHEKELPVTLDVPVKEGYNFAGWYTDSSYTKKVTEITKKSPSELVLFAKWTKTIDSYLNVEMYSYHTGNLLAMNQKELRQCSYNFMDELSIPGMPSTREKDYVNNYINTADMCMQGLCFTPDYVIMTAYTEDKNEPGALMVFDRETGDYLVTLGMKKDSHLGGVAFDGENLWVCHSNSNTLERISYEYIRLIAEDAPGYCIDASAISEDSATVTSNEQDLETTSSSGETSAIASYENNFKKGDVYLTGNDVVVNDIIDGNLFVFANSVTINSQIGGDAFILAGTVNVGEQGYIFSNLFTCAQNVNISGVVYDLYTTAQTVSING